MENDVMTPAKRTNQKEIRLNPDTDFTLASLRDFLNDKFGQKDSGKPFNIQDIQQYRDKRHLPEAYGGHDIEYIEIPDIGIKVLRLKNFSRAGVTSKDTPA